MSKTRALFGVAMAMALPIAIEAAVSAAEVTPPAAPPVPQATPLEASFPLLIESGSNKTFTDSQGRVWRADEGFIGGNVVDRGAIAIDATIEDRLYQTERWGLSGYTAKVPNGKYTVRLHFAETYHDAAGARLFSLKVEDRTIANLDVFAEAGGKNKALIKTLEEVVVADGELNIDFTGAGALVNAVEVASALPPAPPVVTLSGGSIRENVAAGEQVATVVAKGATGDVFRYSLSNNASGRFAIDAQTGVITVAAGAVLDYESATSHAIEVAVTDAKGVTTKQPFTITVLDVSEPPAITLSGGSIRENAAAGEQVATVVAKGAATDVFRYALANSAGGRFAVDAQTGVITVAAGAVLDYETATSHAVEVAVTDAKGATTKQQFTITILDVNEVTPPTFTLSGGSIRENAAAGEQVATVVAKGAASDVFRYALSNNAGGHFAVDAQTGVITVAAGAVLDYESATSHEIEVAATDAKNVTTKQRFTITVLDVNEAAGGLKLTQLIAENAPAGTEVGVVTPLDQIVTKPFFSLKNDAGGRFVIDADTGVIRVCEGASLDAETARSHSVTAVADAGSGRVMEQTFEVALADVNEPPIAIFMSAQTVDAGAAAGTLVGIASALDQDRNDTFTYILVDDAQGRFVINAQTGAVSVAANAKLDPLAAPSHRIIVKATDSAGHSLTNGFTLTVRSAGTPSAQPILIDTGSTADVVDAQGRKWTADTGFTGGGVVDRGAIEIAGTANDRLYQTERWGMTGYSLPIASGVYTVKLHFAETYATAAGSRIFSVDVEGQKLTDIDVFAAVGARTAMVRSVPNVVVTDGKLDIGFTAKAGAAVINAIEVEPAQAAAQ